MNVRISHFYVNEWIRVPTVQTMRSKNNAQNHATPAKVHTYIIDYTYIVQFGMRLPGVGRGVEGGQQVRAVPRLPVQLVVI